MHSSPARRLPLAESLFVKSLSPPTLKLPRLALFSIFFFLFSLLLSSPASATIHYTISTPDPASHWLHVSVTIPDVPSSVTISLPAWNALYQIRDFAHRVSNLRAHEAAALPVTLTKIDKQSWRIHRLARSARGDITITYRIFWDDPGSFSAQLSEKHAFLNLALILPYVPERRAEDVRISFASLPASWRIAVALPADPASNHTFTAPNYDVLVDSPFELSDFDDFRFTANNARIRVVVHGQSPGRDKLTSTLSKIVAYQTTLMRDVPFDEFLFIFHFGEGGGGGMEHANSTAIHLGASSDFAGISAHEFFHLWNVKRIRPKSLDPTNFSSEQYTRSLWFAEGVTSTYASYTLLRSGLWSDEQFFNDLAAEIAQLESRPARLWKSVEEASLDAWFEKYSLYRRPELSISYYNKGQILGVLLDILLRDASDNRASLDDVLRFLNVQYAKKSRPYDDSASLLAASSEVLLRSAKAAVATPPRFPRVGSGITALSPESTESTFPTPHFTGTLVPARHLARNQTLLDFMHILKTRPFVRVLDRSPDDDPASIGQPTIYPHESPEERIVRESKPRMEWCVVGKDFPFPPPIFTLPPILADQIACPLCSDSSPSESPAPAPPQWLRDFFSNYISGVAPLPYDDILARAGLRLTPRSGGGFQISPLPNPSPKQRRILNALLLGVTD